LAKECSNIGLAQMSEIKIKIENLYKIFGSRPREYTDIVRDGVDKDELLSKYNHVLGLDNISLDIKEHSIQVVMGLSGSGKSTLIRHINRLIEPTEGTVTVDGEDITKLNKMDLLEFRRNKTGMVFQRFALFPHQNILDNVQFGLSIKNLDKSDSIERAMYWIEKVGLTGFENKFPNQLSGGMQQRVGLARALATDPDILLMDEAFSALDPLIRTDMQDQLLDLQKNLNKTIMFITHDLDEALKLGDRIAILNGGKLVQDGNAEEILLKPADQYVANFVKDVNRIKVLKIKTILDQGGERANSNPTVNVNDSIENCLPAILESQSGLNVIDEKNNFVGSVSKNKIIDILQKSKD
jgi:glycine betaine/proline transport system ATP-binding protein